MDHQALGGETIQRLARGDRPTTVTLGDVVDPQPLERAIEAARALPDGDSVLVEQGMAGLSARGYSVRVSDRVGRVNAIACPDGLPAEVPNCRFMADPRGPGYGTAAQ